MKLTIFLLASLSLFGGQSLLVSTNYATNASFPARSHSLPWRVEFYLHDWINGPANNSTIAISDAIGMRAVLINAGGDRLELYTTWETDPSGFVQIPISAISPKGIYVRYQHDPIGKIDYYEAWDITGTRIFNQTTTYTTENTNALTGVQVGDAIAENRSVAFFRIHTTLLPLNSRTPVSADNSNVLLHWKFDGTLADASGNGYNATISSGLATYVPTPYQNVISTIKTASAPVWGNWTSWRAGTPSQLDGSSSFSQGDATAAVAYAWQCLSGPSTPVWDSHTTATPTLSGLIFGTYNIQLVATDSAGTTATTTLNIGVVATDANGVVVNADPNVDALMGPLIAFGKNPWGWTDERNMKGLDLRNAAYNTADQYSSYSYANPSWDNLQTGTVGYNWNGLGNVIGAAGTTLSSAISSTALTITVANAALLDWSELPTRILIQASNSAFQFEEIRICNRNVNTLTVCYDGRGVGNTAGESHVLSAQSWPINSIVGQGLVKGTGTNFLNTICPGGIGQAGPVTYSTGTVTVTAGSATVIGVGTSWSAPNDVFAGYAIQVYATHAAVAFTWIAHISTVGGVTSMTANRIYPADADNGTFTYKIIRPFYRNVVTHFTRLAPFAGDAVTNWGSTGCESATESFFNMGYLGHDVPLMDGVPVAPGVGYSWQDNTGYVGFGSTGGIDFYGEDIAWRALYYRSGLTKAKTTADSVSRHWIRYPLGSGLGVAGPTLFAGGPVIGATMSYVLTGLPVINDIRPFWNQTALPGIGCDADDTRDTGYAGAMLIHGAIYDPDVSSGGWRSSFRSLLTALNTRDNNCKRTNGGVDTNSWANGFLWNGSGAPLIGLTLGLTAGTGTALSPTLCDGVDIGTATVTNGSPAVTAATGSFTAGISSIMIAGKYFQFTRTSATTGSLSVLWPGASGTLSFMSRNTNLGTAATALTAYANSNSDPALKNNYACLWKSSTSITLDRNFLNSTGTYSPYIGNLAGYGQQPYMLGIKTYGMGQAAALDGALGLNYGALRDAAGNWVHDYGRDLDNGGTRYGVGFSTCESGGTATGSFVWRTPGCSYGLDINGIVASRELNAEAGSGMTVWYQANPSASSKIAGDTFYGAIWCFTPYNDPSVSSTCDARSVGNNSAISNLNDISLTGGKWNGFFFGMGMAHQWPAVRLGGVLPAVNRTIMAGFNLASVPNAVTVNAILTAPSGAIQTVTCTSSPCSLAADARQGNYLIQLQYSKCGTGRVGDR